MRKTDNNFENLGSVISSDAFAALREMMEDLDLEIVDVVTPF